MKLILNDRLFVLFLRSKQGPGDDYITSDDQLAQDGDLYDDVITTQSSGTDFTDITNTVNQNNARVDSSNGLITGGNIPSSGYNGKRVSLYIGQLTWVCEMNIFEEFVKIYFILVDN